MTEKKGQVYNAQHLKDQVDRFPNARMLVVGDIIMDEYLWGDVSRISPEAPVPVVDIKNETKMFGGAANVVRNIATLGARPILCGVVGNDRTGKEIIDKLKDMDLITAGVVVEKERPTSIKTRVVAHNQQVVRFDRESRAIIAPETIQKLLKFISANLKKLDAIVVTDYGKGVISAPLMKGLRDMVDSDANGNVAIAVDPKTGNFEYYRGVDVLTPNHHEAGSFCNFDVVDEASLIQAGKRMLSQLKCRSVLITQGKDGMTLFENNGEITHIPTVAKKVYDVTGAGDTVIGTFSVGLACALDLKSAAILSNLAAGIVVGEVGTSSVKAEELKKVINNTNMEALRDE
jgi:rfaE bifunctional protein kinase chain/domain